jgi:hypothetical protein
VKPIHWAILIAIVIAVASCEEEAELTSQEVASTCSFIKSALRSNQEIISGQNQAALELNERIAADDPAYAEALSEYPSLSSGILLGNNWEMHALRMIAMYSKAAQMLPEGSEFGGTLKDSSFVWYKRLILKQTPPGQTKGRLSMEQIELDTREGGANRSMIREICGISKVMLP